MLEGFPIAGKFSSQRLRLFVPRKGTELEELQAIIEKEWHDREEMEDRVEDKGREESGTGPEDKDNEGNRRRGRMKAVGVRRIL